MTPEGDAETCEHAETLPVALDQTAGVECWKCRTVLGYCWMDKHVSEAMWNRACGESSDFKPCEQSRENVCAICSQGFTP